MQSIVTTAAQGEKSRRGTLNSQPLQAAQHDDALLKMRTVTALVGLSASSIYRLVAAGELKAIKRGTRCTRFRAGDITAWLRAQGQAA